jgi:hypothetical protein
MRRRERNPDCGSVAAAAADMSSIASPPTWIVGPRFGSRKQRVSVAAWRLLAALWQRRDAQPVGATRWRRADPFSAADK